jgi:hypothetical protein
MRQETRFKFNAYLSRVAELNGIDPDDVSKKFSVEPSVTQTMMNTVQMSSAFLQKINIVPVDELKGEKIGVGVNGTIASTTDTNSGKERKTADFTALESKNTSAIRSTLTSISNIKSWICGRASRTSSAVFAMPSSSVRRSISSWPGSTALSAPKPLTAHSSDVAGCRRRLAAEIPQ